jgi:serine/threonine protein kinase
MDYADGGDLHQRIVHTRKAGKTFEQDKILRWCTEASLALKYMHDKHVLHRDLKSQNLFLNAQDRLRIGDFGISKVLGGTSAFAKTAIGTPYYLSPEICMEKPYSFASDMWALGCILYEIATLRVPFDASSLQSLMNKITRGPTPVIPSTYSAELRQIGCELLHREHKLRPSATEILKKGVIQDEIRKMLRQEQAKNSAKENQENLANQDREVHRETPLKSPSLGSDESTSDSTPLSARHRSHTPLKGAGFGVFENCARIREPLDSREARLLGKIPVPPRPSPFQPRNHYPSEHHPVGCPSRLSSPSSRRHHS